MKKIFLKIFIVFLKIYFTTFNTKSQTDVLFSNFINNLTFNSPSGIITNYNPSILVVYRNHYPALSSAFRTYVFQYYHYFENINSGFSIGILNDVQGNEIFQIINPNIAYQYLIYVNNNLKLNFGLQYVHIIKNINSSKLVFETDLTGETNDYNFINRQFISDFSSGMSIFYKKFFSNFSLFHLFSLNKKTNLPLRLSISGGYIFDNENNRSSEITKILAAFKVDFQDNFNTILYGINIYYRNTIIVGSWLRNDLTFKFDSWGIMLGLNLHSYNIFYNFDVNLKKFGNFNIGFSAHEVTFLYEFKYNNTKKKKIEKLKCPKVAR